MQNRKKLLLGAIFLALLSGLLIFWQRSAISFALYERAVSERVGRDSTANLPDGLHVALCGTGSPLPDPDRAGPCNVVIAGKQIFVVDTGEGGGRNISLMGIPVGKISVIFLTHFHSDHIDGMGPLTQARWTSGTATIPLPVYGPTGVDKVVAGFNATYAANNTSRTEHHGPGIAHPAGAGTTAMPFALPEEGQGDTVVVLERDGLKVTAIRVDHGPVKPAVGYHFDYRGRSLVISGDTKKSQALANAAKGADLLVHEALKPKMLAVMTRQLEKAGTDSIAQITRDIIDYHASPEEAAEVAAAAGVRQLVLSHLIPPVPFSLVYDAFLGEAPKRFAGPITVGEDGMIFTLAVGRDDIVKQELM